MTWARLEDSYFENRKVQSVSTRAACLHIASIVYCARHLMDGEITPAALRVVLAWADATKKQVAELVTAKLWETSGINYIVHDYLEYNPSAEEVAEKRAARSEAGRVGGLAKGQANAKQNAKQDAKQNAYPITPIPVTRNPLPVKPDDPKKKPVCFDDVLADTDFIADVRKDKVVSDRTWNLEVKKMRTYLEENPKLKNLRNFVRNWMEKVPSEKTVFEFQADPFWEKRRLLAAEKSAIAGSN